MSDAAQAFRGLPPPAPFSDRAVIRWIDDALVLRRATVGDVEALAAFDAVGLAEAGETEPSRPIATWVRELAGGDHPRTRASDFLIVEDVRAHRIASSSALLSHALAYEGVALPAGQPELIATHPDYRRRGLVRLQLDELHRWSAERGQALQLIDGIPWFYRQFGYEYALEHFEGRSVAREELPDAHPPGHRVREAARGDRDFLARTYATAAAHSALACLRDAASWDYELSRNPMSYGRRELRIVEDTAGRAVAAFAHYPVLVLDGRLFATFFQAAPGAGWAAAGTAALAALRRAGRALAERDGGAFTGVDVLLGHRHRLYDELPALLRDPRPGSGYYVRVPDLVDLVRRIAPALERRLAGSKHAGFSGTVTLDLFRSGVRIALEAGRVREIDASQAHAGSPALRSGDAAPPGHVRLPELTVLQLVFGFRSLPDLCAHFPDALVTSRTEGDVVDALFPRRPSPIWLTW